MLSLLSALSSTMRLPPCQRGGLQRRRGHVCQVVNGRQVQLMRRQENGNDWGHMSYNSDCQRRTWFRDRNHAVKREMLPRNMQGMHHKRGEGHLGLGVVMPVRQNQRNASGQGLARGVGWTAAFGPLCNCAVCGPPLPPSASLHTRLRCTLDTHTPGPN